MTRSSPSLSNRNSVRWGVVLLDVADALPMRWISEVIVFEKVAAIFNHARHFRSRSIQLTAVSYLSDRRRSRSALSQTLHRAAERSSTQPVFSDVAHRRRTCSRVTADDDHWLSPPPRPPALSHQRASRTDTTT